MGSKSACVIGLMFFLFCMGVIFMDRNWDRIENENNAFAKDCNDRSGMVIFGAYARQCLCARPTQESK